MKKQHSLDMTKLFGFSDSSGQVDISTPVLAARIGAKVGGGEPGIEQTEPLDTEQLFGFEAIATEVDFSDASVASRVGAKVGVESD